MRDASKYGYLAKVAVRIRFVIAPAVLAIQDLHCQNFADFALRAYV